MAAWAIRGAASEITSSDCRHTTHCIDVLRDGFCATRGRSAIESSSRQAFRKPLVCTRRVLRHCSEQQATRYSSRRHRRGNTHTVVRCGPSFLGKYEKRRAAWCMTSTSIRIFVPLLPRAVPSSHLLPTQARQGGARVRGAVRCECVRAM